MKTNKIIHYLNLIRVKQVHKSLVVFAPFILSLNYHLNVFILSLYLFFSFVITSSVIYILNDIKDLANDRKHELKKYRPIAAGYIPKKNALFFMYFLIFLAICSFFFLKKNVVYLLIFYISINVLYTYYIKSRFYYCGAIIVSLGFVIRLISGSIQTDISISNWFILCIFLASLIMIFSKRYSDSFLTKENKKLTNSNEIKLNIKITSLAMILVYIIFTFSSYAYNNFSSYLHLSTIFLILAIVRFVKETLTNKITSDPSSFLLKDFYFLLFSFCWFIFFIISKLNNV